MESVPWKEGGSMPWKIDSKRPTNATKKSRQSQSLRDKQKHRDFMKAVKHSVYSPFKS